MNEKVSFDSEELILVDSNDVEQGSLSKFHCHEGSGMLHRAFSIFLFNSSGQLLLQQRSNLKPLWPLYWSNSCCSHPRVGESMESAAHRRLEQELGVSTDLTSVYQFEYRAKYLDVGTEHELCTVFIGSSDQEIEANENEINALEWVDPANLQSLIRNKDFRTTPWMELEWQTLNANYAHVLP